MKRPDLQAVALALYKERGQVSIWDLFAIKEAIASVALEYPEWDEEE